MPESNPEPRPDFPPSSGPGSLLPLSTRRYQKSPPLVSSIPEPMKETTGQKLRQLKLAELMLKAGIDCR
jgi:hypothetical protein